MCTTPMYTVKSGVRAAGVRKSIEALAAVPFFSHQGRWHTAWYAPVDNVLWAPLVENSNLPPMSDMAIKRSFRRSSFQREAH